MVGWDVDELEKRRKQRVTFTEKKSLWKESERERT